MQRTIVYLAFLTLLLSGCAATDGDGDASPTPSPTSGPPPAPKELETKEMSGCGTPPAPTGTYEKAFTVDEAYDTLIIDFHWTGQGTFRATVTQIEGNKLIWSQTNPQTPPVPPTQCGTHSHSGSGIEKAVDPGEYKVNLSYTGAISMHFDVTAKSSKSNETIEHDNHTLAR